MIKSGDMSSFCTKMLVDSAFVIGSRITAYCEQNSKINFKNKF